MVGEPSGRVLGVELNVNAQIERGGNMGFRTIVLLNNDRCTEWENDPELGRKIAIGMNYVSKVYYPNMHENPADLRYGKVIECAHSDQETLAVIESHSYHPIATSFWYAKEDDDARNLKLLKLAARKLGYRLTKLPKGKDEHVVYLGEIGHGG